MSELEKDVLGCVVRDVQNGSVFGWVKSVVRDGDGEAVSELLVDSSKMPDCKLNEREEQLIGRSLFDPNGRFIGEITDVVLGTDTGFVRGVVVERRHGDQSVVPSYHCMKWSGDHWALTEWVSGFPSLQHGAIPDTGGAPDASDDWMVGYRAAACLLDSRGQVLIEQGQPVTAILVEQALRAGVLHKLEVEI